MSMRLTHDLWYYWTDEFSRRLLSHSSTANSPSNELFWIEKKLIQNSLLGVINRQRNDNPTI